MKRIRTSYKSEEQRLKYLKFVHAAAASAGLRTVIYIFTKENSGLLTSGVEIVEGAVKNVVGAVYDKFHGVPIDEVKHHVPPRVKEASKQTVSAA